MPPKRIESLSLDELIKVYGDAIEVERHDIDDWDVTPAQARKSAARTQRIFEEIEARGGEALLAMLILLDDPRRGVKLRAAFNGMELAPKKAEAVLLKLARGDEDDNIVMVAQIRLTEWKEGRGRFRMDGDPPFELGKPLDEET
jgi:hypothetical protein